MSVFCPYSGEFQFDSKFHSYSFQITEVILPLLPSIVFKTSSVSQTATSLVICLLLFSIRFLFSAVWSFTLMSSSGFFFLIYPAYDSLSWICWWYLSSSSEKFSTIILLDIAIATFYLDIVKPFLAFSTYFYFLILFIYWLPWAGF